MVENQCFRLEQRSAIKFLMTEKYKPYEIYTRTYTEKCFSKKKMSKNGFANINLSWKGSLGNGKTLTLVREKNSRHCSL